MIPWWAGILLFMAGVVTGMILIAFMNIAKDEDEKQRWWNDD